MAIGAGITLVLSKASYVFIGFPLHPIGFALAACFAMEYDWPAFLGMWAIKSLILRYSGRDLYSRLRSFFLGVILSGLITPILWGLATYLLKSL